MLRAVRFAATFGFAIEPATLAAIQQLAGELVIVAAERIAAELRRMLVPPRRTLAVELLQQSGLLPVILPEAVALDASGPHEDPAEVALRWQTTLAILNHLQQPTFPVALAVLLRPLVHLPRGGEPVALAEQICRRWKLANDEIEVVCHLIGQEATIRAAPSIPWPQLQRLLIAPYVEELLTYCSAVSRVVDGEEKAVQFCRSKLALPAAELNPPPLLSGNDLIQLGLPPGPEFKRVLDTLRDAQLEGKVTTPDQALQWVKSFLG
jgi:tRNA nucleotidyltransferase/poly(A) polymerase